jgi:hypothetical protein
MPKSSEMLTHCLFYHFVKLFQVSHREPGIKKLKLNGWTIYDVTSLRVKGFVKAVLSLKVK